MSTRLHPHLRAETSGPVHTLTLVNPTALNAQTPSLWLALAQAAREVPDTVRVVVLAAEGGSFSAGLNRAMFTPAGMPGEPPVLAMAAGDPDAFRAEIARYQEGFTAWREVDAIVVAAVQGHAIGAGFQLALGADLRIVTEDVSFAMKEPALGMIPDLGGTRRLVEIVGPARALDICATTRAVGAGEALSLGLAQRVVPTAALTTATAEYVAALLAAEPGALRELKPLLRDAADRSPADQLVAEAAAQQRLLSRLVGGSSR